MAKQTFNNSKIDFFMQDARIGNLNISEGDQTITNYYGKSSRFENNGSGVQTNIIYNSPEEKPKPEETKSGTVRKIVEWFLKWF